MKLTLRGQLLVVALIGLGTIALGVTMSYASGRDPLPDPPGSYTAVTSR